MLMPALQKARSRARTTSCINQVKNLGSSVLNYCGDNRDEIMPGRLPKTVYGTTTEVYWSWLLYRNKYVSNPRMFYCPELDVAYKYSLIGSGESAVEKPNQSTPYRYTTYGFNYLLGDLLNGHEYRYKIGRIKNPSHKILMGDTRQVNGTVWAGNGAADGTGWAPRHGGNNGIVLGITSSTYDSYSAFGSGTCTLFFVDGHVGSLSAQVFAQFGSIRAQYISWQ